MLAISACWAVMVPRASRRTSSSSQRSRQASAISTAAWWWGIISRKKRTSASATGRSRSCWTSSGEAIPGIRPSIVCPIQAIAGSLPVKERSHSSSQPVMVPISACWVSTMSVAKACTVGSAVRSRMMRAISTAWSWWTLMSRRKPASAEPSLGGRGHRYQATPPPRIARRTSPSMSPGRTGASDSGRGGEAGTTAAPESDRRIAETATNSSKIRYDPVPSGRAGRGRRRPGFSRRRDRHPRVWLTRGGGRTEPWLGPGAHALGARSAPPWWRP